MEVLMARARADAEKGKQWAETEFADARTEADKGWAFLQHASLIQKLAAGVGALFLLLGILGFIPGITHRMGDISFAEHHSQAELFHLFQVSVLHNLIHLATGTLGLAASRKASWARLFLIGGGIVYLIFTLWGGVVDRATDWNFVPFNRNDNWLHLGLGAGMVALGALGLAAGEQKLESPMHAGRGDQFARTRRA
jgi:hypothetical protein